MKTSIKIALLKRRIRRTEKDWPTLLKRVAEYSPEEQRLAFRVYKSALEKDRSELQKLLLRTRQSN